MIQNNNGVARKAGASVGALAVALALVACAETATSTESAPTSDASSSAAVCASPSLALFGDMTPADDAVAVDTTNLESTKEKFKVAYVDFGPVNSWRVQAAGSTQQLADELGVELIVTNAEGDATKQIADAEDALAQGVDAMLISPISPAAVVPVIEKASATGIPVIVWGSDAESDKYTAKVLADDFFFGYAGGVKLAEDIGGSGKQVFMLRGIAGNSVEQARYDGAAAALSEAGVEIVAEEYGDWAYDKGKSITENLLATYPDIDGIWASGAAMTLGAMDAFKDAGKPLVPMSGENLNSFMLTAVEENLQTSAPQFPTWQGPEALKLAIRSLCGLEISNSYLLKPPAITDMKAASMPDVSGDYWVENYLTDEQIAVIFP
jgi:ribose transport system substrate-binding protein